MGMYTEIFFRSSLRRDVPEDVVSWLRYLAGYIGEDTAFAAYPLPDHGFFKKQRWDMVGRGGSAYFPVNASHVTQDSHDGTWTVLFLANLKNYDGEIESFFHWIDPYCGETIGQFIGYELYEERDEPLIYIKETPFKFLDLEKAKFWKDSVKKETPF